MARVSRSRIALLVLGILTLLGTSPLAAQGQGKWILTIDGEIRSLDIRACTLSQEPQGLTDAHGHGTDAAGRGTLSM